MKGFILESFPTFELILRWHVNPVEFTNLA
jgi:hypothetical protein